MSTDARGIGFHAHPFVYGTVIFANGSACERVSGILAGGRKKIVMANGIHESQEKEGMKEGEEEERMQEMHHCGCSNVPGPGCCEIIFFYLLTGRKGEEGFEVYERLDIV